MTAPLVPVQIWAGSGSVNVVRDMGKVPLGTFDDDDCFIEAAPRVADWIASRLGYPVMNVELTDKMIYACFEEATMEYSAIINEFNMRENMIALQGISTGSNISQKVITGTPLPMIIEVSQQYGQELGVQGNIDYKMAAITASAGIQEYDLATQIEAVYENGNRIEVRRVFNERIPAIQRFFDPFANSGTGTENFLGQFGWGGYSVATQFLLLPVYETLLRTQAIEINDTVRRSQYAFEIRNNKIKIYPIPTSDEYIFIEYTVKADKFAGTVGGGMFQDKVSDFSNAPYDYISYGNINDVGRRWILKYAFACAKETLGLIRSKYDSLPIPNSEVRLDGTTLRNEAAQEKEILWTQLRESLEEAGKRKQMEKTRDNADDQMEILKKIPMLIFIG